ncbi:MAG: lysine 2,3-aminomutase [Desulfococcus sp. 4484_241]|nr:MAG: lysine 2,3-aminomutase [Desulfococcus sp. 4484_241]
MADGVTSVSLLPEHIRVDAQMRDRVCASYPMFINRFFLSLIKKAEDPLWRQVVPDAMELDDDLPEDDPLAEEEQSAVPGLIHRYPDRVVFLVSGICPVLCRFCLRKRMAGKGPVLSDADIENAVCYIRSARAIREVILSGGDPLMLEDDRLCDILKRVSSIPHVRTIRIHSRVPVALPQRITGDLVSILRRFHPLYLNIHANHPNEITARAAEACAMLADAGIPLGSQTVLLKGVNDSFETMEALLMELLHIRVRPYYLHHPDPVKGTGHFRVPVTKGLEIMRRLQGRLPGVAIPRYMLDLPGGGGKVPLCPGYVEQDKNGMLVVRNYQGQRFYYPSG